MAIQDTDFFLIEDGTGTSKKVLASKLKDNLLEPGYNNFKLLVNNSSFASFFVYTQNLQSRISASDYMMVERGGVTYRVPGQQVIDYFPTVPVGSTDIITEIPVAMNRSINNVQVIEVASSVNLSNRVPGDSFIMTDFDGNAISHVNETSTITNVVQVNRNWSSVLSSNNGFFSGRPATAAFDGREVTIATTNPGGAMTWNPGSNGPVGNCIRGKTTGLFDVYVDDGNGNPVIRYTWGAFTGNFTFAETYFPQDEKVMKLVGTNGVETCGLWTVQVGSNRMVDGPTVVCSLETDQDLRSFQFNQLVQSREGTDVQVIGVDVANKIIITNGGKYKGTDGTEVDTDGNRPDIPLASTVRVKSSAISGSATYVSHTGNLVTVNNSNGCFVKVPNSAGVDYYMRHL